MPDHVGQQLGSYQLIQMLGQGQWGSVYLGEHVHLRTQAAIKLLHGPWDEREVEGFLGEARTLASLRHPHIVRVLDFGVQQGTPFLVMEYAPGGTLRRLHPKGMRLPLQTVVTYLKQVASALQYAHDQRLIHRDLKPENLLLGHDQQVWLSDFGLAVVAHSARSQPVQQTAGTLAYMAPEQLRGHATAASDQYALGVLAYEWLAGERPFSGSSTQVAVQQTLASPSLLREKVPTLPPLVERVVMRALALGLLFLGLLAFAQGDVGTARALLEESLALFRTMGNQSMITHCLASVAIVAVAQGQLSWGVRLLGAVETMREARGVPRPPVMQGFYEQSLASARAGLGEEAFAAVWAQGRAMTPEQALAARDPVPTTKPPTPARAPTAPRPAYPDGLTEREVEVLRLVAQGMTDAQVAEQLVLSPHTIQGQLRSIYQKIHVKSRRAAMQYAIEHQLI